jgi:hypothetical protein
MIQCCVEILTYNQSFFNLFYYHGQNYKYILIVIMRSILLGVVTFPGFLVPSALSSAIADIEANSQKAW